MFKAAEAELLLCYLLIMELLLPLIYKDPEDPLIFLAGPVRGGGRWQDEAIRILSPYPVSLASPYRDGVFSKLKDEDHTAQADWESHYLELAGQEGVILFWLPRQHEERKRGLYAQTTRVELGLWLAGVKYFGAKVVIGGEEEFSGLRYIRYQAQKVDIRVCDSLEATCQAALDTLGL